MIRTILTCMAITALALTAATFTGCKGESKDKPAAAAVAKTPQPFVHAAEFNGEKIPITVFYSQVSENEIRLDSLVFEHDGKTQTVRLQEFEGVLNFSDADLDKFGYISLSDYNFDGSFDIGIYSGTSGVSNTKNEIFIYNAETKSFAHNEELSALANIELDSKTQAIRSAWKGGIAGLEYYSYEYKWEEGKLTLIGSVKQDYDETSENYIRITQTLQKGKLKQKTDTIYDAEPLIDARDGQTYRTVKIGKQTWMAQNLNIKSAKSECYDNKESNCKKYGRLYNWDEAMKACPVGWHLSDGNEWYALFEYAGGREVAGKRLRAKSGWKDGGNGTDKFGFSALPEPGGREGGWWSSSDYNSPINIYSESAGYGDMYPRESLFSVRCVKDLVSSESQSIEWSASSTMASQGIISYYAAFLKSTDNSAAWCEGVEGQGIGERVNAKVKAVDSTHIKSLVIANGYAKNQATWKNNSRIKTLRLYVGGKHWEDLHLSDNIKAQTIQLRKSIPFEGGNQLDLSFEIAEVYPGSKFEDACITGILFDIYRGDDIVDLRDGQSYRIAKIGKQIWMAENLNYAPRFCYDDKESNCEKYGGLYGWNGAVGACPAGWHLPGGREWEALFKYAGGDEVAEKKLKATSGWNKQKSNGTDNYGFSALPGGCRPPGDKFYDIGYYGSWWTPAEYGDGEKDWATSVSIGESESGECGSTFKWFGRSVRCVKDESIEKGEQK